MQAVCDHKRKIIDVFIGYPGSVHDSWVFRNSPLKNNLHERYFLSGDSGYPLHHISSYQENLLTPYKDRGNLTRRQNYNIKLSKNRYIIEHCFGVLKQKYRQLFHVKLRSEQFIVHFIRACVLHNIALEDTFVVNEVEDLPDIQGEIHPEGFDEDNIEIAHIRDSVANNLTI